MGPTLPCAGRCRRLPLPSASPAPAQRAHLLVDQVVVDCPDQHLLLNAQQLGHALGNPLLRGHRRACARERLPTRAGVIGGAGAAARRELQGVARALLLRRQAAPAQRRRPRRPRPQGGPQLRGGGHLHDGPVDPVVVDAQRQLGRELHRLERLLLLAARAGGRGRKERTAVGRRRVWARRAALLRALTRRRRPCCVRHPGPSPPPLGPALPRPRAPGPAIGVSLGEARVLLQADAAKAAEARHPGSRALRAAQQCGVGVRGTRPWDRAARRGCRLGAGLPDTQGPSRRLCDLARARDCPVKQQLVWA